MTDEEWEELKRQLKVRLALAEAEGDRAKAGRDRAQAELDTLKAERQPLADWQMVLFVTLAAAAVCGLIWLIATT